MQLNLEKIQSLIDAKKIGPDTVIDLESLKKTNILNKSVNKLKILGTGEIKFKVNLKVDFASKSAKQKIENVGGNISLNTKK